MAAAHRTLRALADQALSRTAGAPLIGGNQVRLLQDARENYPAWEAAIRAATHTIHLEMYIIHHDRVGRRFVDLLAAKAREGVAVRVIYDWFGCGTGPMRGLFKPLVLAGGDVRVFNPPTLSAMFGWVRRNHRKLLVVDGAVAYIGGLCIGEAWEGQPDRGRAPWRDTAVEIRGPAVAHAEVAFVESWQYAGGATLPDGEVAAWPDDEMTRWRDDEVAPVAVRVISTEPFTANMLRVDLFVAAMARDRLWITDAYFMGHGPFADALMQAARDGVDVRLLLPHGSDVGWTVPVSRTLYRALLDAGVKVYEWTGSMIHAKTAVADGRWSRVGSTNLNINSWLGNWELDVTMEDTTVAAAMEAQFLDDLAKATAITRDASGRLIATPVRGMANRTRRSARRVAREVTGVARSLGAAVTGSRPLEDFEVGPLLLLAALFSVTAVAAWFRPALVAWPIAAVATWAGLTLLIDAWHAWRAAGRSPR
jgi:phosphatidylserine/phosphatidylglycerophosphate/cardiolipin synthase-like enzyme